MDLPCIDELGYMEPDRHGAELLFQVLTEREEKNSIASFQRIVLRLDRNLHGPAPLRRNHGPAHGQGAIIETGIDSYRLAHTIAHQTP